jgi:hypothetical protein
VEAGLKNGVKNELGISIRMRKKLASVDHAYTHFRATLCAYDCTLLKSEPEALGCQDWRWASDTDIGKLPMSKIDRKILAAIDLRRSTETDREQSRLKDGRRDRPRKSDSMQRHPRPDR